MTTSAGTQKRAKRAPSKKATIAALTLAPRILAGRTAPEPEVIRWVARNIDNPSCSAKDCPDPFAWTLLRECRLNPAFRFFFIEKLWSRLMPSRAQEEADPDDDKVDGAHVLDVIEQIQAIHARIVGPAVPATVPIGEIPVPPSNAFADFEPGEDGQ